MIELTQKEAELLMKLEKENSTDYNIIKVHRIDKDIYYIYVDSLIVCLEETQDYREYAEMKVKELANVIEGD